ncbi:unnamed protein product [Cuscuta epithymum]|uniref:Retrovirus-related Pol polyprotein from transposon TNT 1-94-like beta-barrel domain-containing protein n=1 Tax=Cuscuta epithymum TaxID=186058 RepID=A0AAV0EKZ0_9ASTE|nr:unnamed protein product [Cuscuta epithymum]
MVNPQTIAGQRDDRRRISGTENYPRNTGTQANSVGGCPAEEIKEQTAEPKQFPTLSADQWNSFMEFMKKFKTGDNVEKLAGIKRVNWLLDTGASYHMTGDKNVMFDITPVTSIPVTLPNGNITCASHIGRVVIGPGVTLDRVLLVPNLTCHLISVGRLIDDLPCHVIFTNKFV